MGVKLSKPIIADLLTYPKIKMDNIQDLDLYFDSLLTLLENKGVIDNKQEFWDIIESRKVANKLAEQYTSDKQIDFFKDSFF